MIGHPMLFRPEMVRALLAGTKTQTRRPAWRVGRLDEEKAAPSWFPTAARRVNVGDLIWVKETHVQTRAGIAYVADGGDHYGAGGRLKLRPSIHMPRRYSRITLAVTAVKIERLQDISEEDAAAEGIVTIPRSITQHGRMDGYGVAATPPEEAQSTRRKAYAALYQSIHGVNAWAANPELVAITFTVHLANVDAYLKKAA